MEMPMEMPDFAEEVIKQAKEFIKSTEANNTIKKTECDIRKIHDFLKKHPRSRSSKTKIKHPSTQDRWKRQTAAIWWPHQQDHICPWLSPMYDQYHLSPKIAAFCSQPPYRYWLNFCVGCPAWWQRYCWRCGPLYCCVWPGNVLSLRLFAVEYMYDNAFAAFYF